MIAALPDACKCGVLRYECSRRGRDELKREMAFPLGCSVGMIMSVDFSPMETEPSEVVRGVAWVCASACRDTTPINRTIGVPAIND